MAVSGQSIGLETVKVSLVRLLFGSRRFVSGLESKPLGFLGRLAYTEIDFAVVPRIPRDPEAAYHWLTVPGFAFISSKTRPSIALWASSTMSDAAPIRFLTAASASTLS